MSLTRSGKRARAARPKEAANRPMLVTAIEAQMILRLRQLANGGSAEARVVLPDLRVETVDSRAIIGLHGSV